MNNFTFCKHIIYCSISVKMIPNNLQVRPKVPKEKNICLLFFLRINYDQLRILKIKESN